MAQQQHSGGPSEGWIMEVTEQSGTRDIIKSAQDSIVTVMSESAHLLESRGYVMTKDETKRHIERGTSTYKLHLAAAHGLKAVVRYEHDIMRKTSLHAVRVKLEKELGVLKTVIMKYKEDMRRYEKCARKETESFSVRLDDVGGRESSRS